MLLFKNSDSYNKEDYVEFFSNNDSSIVGLFNRKNYYTSGRQENEFLTQFAQILREHKNGISQYYVF